MSVVASIRAFHMLASWLKLKNAEFFAGRVTLPEQMSSMVMTLFSLQESPV